MVNSTIRAIRVEEYGDASVLKYTIIPRPIPQRNQVLVKVAYAGINYGDVGQRSGLYPIPLPFTVGLEGSGEIVELGPDVEHGFKVGDRVTFMVLGTYTEYVVVDTVRLGKLPDHVSLELVCPCHFFLNSNMTKENVELRISKLTRFFSDSNDIGCRIPDTGIDGSGVDRTSLHCQEGRLGRYPRRCRRNGSPPLTTLP